MTTNFDELTRVLGVMYPALSTHSCALLAHKITVAVDRCIAEERQLTDLDFALRGGKNASPAGVALRRFRRAAGMSQRQTAGRLGWSIAKVIRIENGDTKLISRTDLLALLDLYRVTDETARNDLLQHAKRPR